MARIQTSGTTGFLTQRTSLGESHELRCFVGGEPGSLAAALHGAAANARYTLMYLRLVGGIQLRQARVSNQSCAIRRFVDECVAQPDGTCQARFDTKDGTCFSEFSVSRQDTQPYGPGTEGFTWSSGHSDLKGLFGFGPDYGDGGYVVCGVEHRGLCLWHVSCMSCERRGLTVRMPGAWRPGTSQPCR